MNEKQILKKIMRERKTRGKRLDTGEWVYGHYFTSPLTNETGGCDSYLCGKPRHQISQDNCTYEVDPETVGDWTGLEDLWEDNLVRFGDNIWIIGWSVQIAGFTLFSVVGQMTHGTIKSSGVPIRDFNFMDDGKKGYWKPEGNMPITDSIKVIGNVHDNKDLLERNE